MTGATTAHVSDDQPAPVRRLVVAVTPMAEDESMASLLNRSTRSNVLGTTQIILREVGLALAHPGTVGQRIGNLAPRLADKIGCPAVVIAALTHEYVDGDEPALVRFGDGVLRRSDLILERRRVSPAAMRRSPYARAAWQCRHLPYDPETLELLIDACPHCGDGLRWSRAWGVEICEHCRKSVLSAQPPRLTSECAESYRAFAKLISIVPSERAAARAGLAPQLAELSQPALIDLIMGIGLALGPNHVAAGRRTITRQPDPERAQAACRGTELIDAWPTRLRSAVVQSWRSSDSTGRDSLLRALRALGDTRAFTAAQAAVVRAALPEAFEDKRRALGSMETPVVLAREITRMAGISSSDVALLRRGEVLAADATTGSLRHHAQFRLDEATDLATRRRASVPITRLEQWLGLPRYAAEQLVASGEVDWEAHPGIVLLDRVPRITSSSLHAFYARLSGAVIPDAAPDDHEPLWAAARRRGGAPKPWGATLAAIARRELRVYAITGAKERPFTRRVAIEAASIVDQAPGSISAVLPAGFPVATSASQADACELLNLDALQIRAVIEAGVLGFEKRGRALAVPLDQVLAHAATMVPASEIGPLLGVRHDAVPAAMRRMDCIGVVPGGWSRAEWEDHVRSRPGAL